MGVFKSLCTAACICFGFGSAALAVPVTFTYTSNAVNWSEMEDWEAQYMAASTYNWNIAQPHLQAQISVEVECDLSSGGVNCAPLTSRTLLGGPSLRSLRTATPAEIALKEISGFTETQALASAFRVDNNGKVLQWDFRGSEYGQVGDFHLKNGGDSWSYAGWNGGYEAEAYCYYALGIPYGVDTCPEGLAWAGPSAMTLGTGTWTSNLESLGYVPRVPLPAGLPLVLSGLGLLAVARRRKTAA